MYFRKLLCTVTFATLASAAVAKQIPTPYAKGESESDSKDVFERAAQAEPEPARTAAWEAAHGGPAPSYKYGEEHDANAWHVARDASLMPEAEPEPGWANVGGNRQKEPGNWAYQGHHAREADDADSEDFGEQEFQDLLARDIEVPDFGDQDVDTSLEGLLERRDFEGDDDDDDESQADLSGYDAGILQRRSDGTADEIDYSLEGYDVPTFANDTEEEAARLIIARDLAEDDLAVDDEYLHSAEHREFLASHGVTERSFADDLEDAEHDRLDERDLGDDIDDHEDPQIPDFGTAKVDTSLEGMHLSARDVEHSKYPDFGDRDIDVSLEGYEQPSVLYSRDADEDEYEYDEDSSASDADAAYAADEVVEELVAPADPELVEREDSPPTPVASSRGWFRIPWT